MMIYMFVGQYTMEMETCTNIPYRIVSGFMVWYGTYRYIWYDPRSLGLSYLKS